MVGGSKKPRTFKENLEGSSCQAFDCLAVICMLSLVELGLANVYRARSTLGPRNLKRQLYFYG